MKSFTTFLCIALALCTIALSAPSGVWLKQDITLDFLEEDCSSESETNTLDDESADKNYVVYVVNHVYLNNRTKTHSVFGVSHIYAEHYSQVASPPPEYIF